MAPEDWKRTDEQQLWSGGGEEVGEGGPSVGPVGGGVEVVGEGGSGDRSLMG